MSWFRSTLGFIGAVMIFTAEISPDEVTSNYAAWAKKLGIDEVPAFLVDPSVDTWGLVIGCILVIISVVSFFLNKKDKTQSKKDPDTAIDLSNISVGIRQHTWPELEENPAKTNILELSQENAVFTRASLNLPYFLSKIAYLNKCVITNHSDTPLFKVVLPMKIEFHKYDQKDAPHHTWRTNVTGDPINLLELKLELIEPVNANDSVTFWICNETEHYAKVIFDEKLLAQAGQDNRIIEIPYTFESINPHSVLQPNFKNMSKWIEEKNKETKSNKHNVSLIEKRLSVAWGNVQGSQFEEELDCTLVEFQCFTVGDDEYQCIPGMKKLKSLKHLNDKTFDVNRLVFTNRGDEPIFKMKIPFRYECCVKNGATGKYQNIVHSDHTHFFAADNESIMPGESVTFCFCNASENDYLIVIHLLDYVDANLFNEDKEVKIRYTWETFKPLHISLRHIPNYHVHG